jgi:hypothetical protein
MKKMNWNLLICALCLAFFTYSCSSGDSSQSTSNSETSMSDEAIDATKVDDSEKSFVEAKDSKVHWKYADVSDIKNKTYRSLTEFPKYSSYQEMGGGLIGTKNQTDYAVSYYVKGEMFLIVFEEVINFESGKVQYKSIDAIEVYGVKPGINLEFNSCKQNGVFDASIIVLYEYKDVEFFTEFFLAWKVDLNKGKIEEINTNNIECYNPGWGV